MERFAFVIDLAGTFVFALSGGRRRSPANSRPVGMVVGFLLCDGLRAAGDLSPQKTSARSRSPRAGPN
jgi:hypothetical protein